MATPGNQDPRVYLAAERTLLAWIRTGLAMMGFGFVVARFGLFLREMAAVQEGRPLRSPGMSLWMGTALVLLGVAVNLMAAFRYRRYIDLLNRGESPVPGKGDMGIWIAVILSMLGTGMAIYLLMVGY